MKENKKIIVGTMAGLVFAVILLIIIIVSCQKNNDSGNKMDNKTEQNMMSDKAEESVQTTTAPETVDEEKTTHPDEVQTDEKGDVASVITGNGEIINVTEATTEVDEEGNTIYTTSTGNKVTVKKDGSVMVETTEEVTQPLTEEVTEVPTPIQPTTETPTQVPIQPTTEAPTQPATEAPTKAPVVKQPCPYQDFTRYDFTLEVANQLFYPQTFSSMSEVAKWVDKINGYTYLTEADTSKPMYFCVYDVKSRINDESYRDKIFAWYNDINNDTFGPFPTAVDSSVCVNYDIEVFSNTINIDIAFSE